MVKLVERLTRLLAWLAGLAVLLMMFHVMIDVLGKYLFSAPRPGKTSDPQVRAPDNTSCVLPDSREGTAYLKKFSSQDIRFIKGGGNETSQAVADGEILIGLSIFNHHTLIHFLSPVRLSQEQDGWKKIVDELFH